MRELSLVIPSDVWLVELTGTVAPGVTVAEGTEINARQTVAGPALSLIGCARAATRSRVLLPPSRTSMASPGSGWLPPRDPS